MSADSPRVAWSSAPDPEAGIYFPVLTPKPDKDLLGIILSECIQGAMTYYVPGSGDGEKGHSLPCTCGEEPCPGRVAKRDHRWKGYLACWDRTKGRLFLAEVTKEAYLRCPAFEVFKGQLRGKIIRLTRAGSANNARVTAAVTMPSGQPFDLPVAFNVRSALERIWFGSQFEKRPANAAASRVKAIGQFGDAEGGSDA